VRIRKHKGSRVRVRVQVRVKVRICKEGLVIQRPSDCLGSFQSRDQGTKLSGELAFGRQCQLNVLFDDTSDRVKVRSDKSESEGQLHGTCSGGLCWFDLGDSLEEIGQKQEDSSEGCDRTEQLLYVLYTICCKPAIPSRARPSVLPAEISYRH
jgi:hypothetical protein